MRTFSSQDLQQQSGETQRAAVSGPVVIMSHGKPRAIVMSVGEFRRLKQRAGETVPSELERPRPVLRRVPMHDPLGYATSDLKRLALTMADAALSGRNREAVHAEIAAVEGRAGSQMSVAELTVEHERRSRILIPDTSPIFLLAMIGSDALDWLYVTNADVWIPDMVKTEATRPPDPGDDQRLEHRATITDWFKRNENRIHIVETHEGIEYAKAMEAWTLAGSKPELKPSWKGRGEKSVLQVLDGRRNCACGRRGRCRACRRQ